MREYHHNQQQLICQTDKLINQIDKASPAPLLNAINIYQFMQQHDSESSSDTVDSRQDYHQQMQAYIYDSSHDSMPSLSSDDDSDWDIAVSTDERSKSNNVMHISSNYHNQSHNNNCNVFTNNNIHFVYDEKQPSVHIGISSEYPPELHPTITAGACSDQQSTQFTNVEFNNGIIENKNLQYNQDKIIIIQNSCDEDEPCILFSHCQTELEINIMAFAISYARV